MMHISDIKAGDRFELVFDGEDEINSLEEYSGFWRQIEKKSNENHEPAGVGHRRFDRGT